MTTQEERTVTRRTHEEVGGPPFRFGMHLVLDLDDCDPHQIRDPQALTAYTKRLVQLIDMLPYGEPWLAHFGHANPITSGYTVTQVATADSRPAGRTVVQQPIETSLISMHLGEDDNSAHIDVFSCQDFNPRVVMAFTEAFFHNRDTTYTVIYR